MGELCRGGCSWCIAWAVLGLLFWVSLWTREIAAASGAVVAPHLCTRALARELTRAREPFTPGSRSREHPAPCPRQLASKEIVAGSPTSKLLGGQCPHSSYYVFWLVAVLLRVHVTSVCFFFGGMCTLGSQSNGDLN